MRPFPLRDRGVDVAAGVGPIRHRSWDVALVAASDRIRANRLRGEVAAEGIREVLEPIALERLVADSQVARPNTVGLEQAGQPARAESAAPPEIPPRTLLDRCEPVEECFGGELPLTRFREHPAHIGKQPDSERDLVCLLRVTAKRDERRSGPGRPGASDTVGNGDERLACILCPVVELVGKLRPRRSKLLGVNRGKLLGQSAESLCLFFGIALTKTFDSLRRRPALEPDRKRPISDCVWKVTDPSKSLRAENFELLDR